MLDNESTRLVFRIIKGWLALVSALEVKPMRGLNVRGPLSFIGVRIPQRQLRAQPFDEKLLQADGSVIIRGARTAVVQLWGYGDDGAALIDELEITRARDDVDGYLFAQNLTVDDMGAALEVNQQYEGEWETRVFRELRVGFIEERTLAAGTGPVAAMVSFELTLQGDDGLDPVPADLVVSGDGFDFGFADEAFA